MSITKKTGTYHVRRIRNKGSRTMNNGNVYHVDEDISYERM